MFAEKHIDQMGRGVAGDRPEIPARTVPVPHIPRGQRGHLINLDVAPAHRDNREPTPWQGVLILDRNHPIDINRIGSVLVRMWQLGAAHRCAEQLKNLPLRLVGCRIETVTIVTPAQQGAARDFHLIPTAREMCRVQIDIRRIAIHGHILHTGISDRLSVEIYG